MITRLICLMIPCATLILMCVELWWIKHEIRVTATVFTVLSVICVLVLYAVAST